MKARPIIWAAAVLGLAALAVWIARNTYWEEVPIEQPLKGDAAINPFYSAVHLAQSLGAHARWQRVIGSMPPGDGVVFASSWNWGMMESRRERLQHWVAAGGRLVIDRSLIGGQDELEDWAGISRYTLSRQELILVNRGTMREKCSTLMVSDGPAAAGDPTRFSVCNPDRTSSLRSSRRTSWVLRDSFHRIQALRVPIGRGSVTLINSTPFGNRELLEGDHGALFVAATQLRRGDPVWFLTEEQGASLLSVIWDTAAPVVILGLALIALWLWRSGVRFGPPIAATDSARRSLAEQIRGTGQFTVRFGGGQALHAAAVRALQETADRCIPGYARLSGAERVSQLALLARTDEGALAGALNFAGPRRLGELRHSLALLEGVRRAVFKTNAQRKGS